MKLSGILLVIAFLAVFLGISNAVTSDCSDGTKYFKCSTTPSYVGFRCGPSGLARDLTCKCEDVPGFMTQGSGDDSTCVQARCDDGTQSGQCATTKPKVCVGGSSYADNASKCGCPAGKKMAADRVFCEFIPCSDGGVSVPENTCSPKKGKKCISGQLVDKASECGCPSGQKQVGESCGVFCDDGTKVGDCSSQKPKECQLTGSGTGWLADNAVKCGCPEGQTRVDTKCAASIFGGLGGSELLGGANEGQNQSSSGSASGSGGLSCCCLPAALILLVGGFAFHRKN